MKKLTGFLLMMILVFSMALSASAVQGTNDNTGKITIQNAVEKQTYDIYQLLILESYDTAKNAYAYKATSSWEAWLRTQTAYVSFDEQGYVIWKTGADPAAFAKAALAEAKARPISPVRSQKATSETVVFENLNLGYYLVDTTLGTLCSLDTTAKEVIMEEKNEEPGVDKKVKEDSTGQYGVENTAQIGDTVEFKTTVFVKKGAENYILHDTMTEGLTLNPDSISVEGLTKGNDYTVATNRIHQKADGSTDYICAFELTFTKAYLDSITEDKELIVTYTAILNEKAEILDGVNKNKTRLEYGEANSTEWKETKTCTLRFDLVKTDKEKKLLEGAEFELYDAKTGGKKLALVKEAAGIYRIATEEEKEQEGFVSAKIEAGKATVKGLDADTTYYLEETKAPDGYNRLKERVEVKMEKRNLTASLEGSLYQEGGVQVINYSGTVLPKTGGMGTTILYVAGILLILAAAAVLLLKRHFRKEA